MDAFSNGPFLFQPGSALRVAGVPQKRWTMLYGSQEIAQRVVDAVATRDTVIAAFDADRAAFVAAARAEHWPARISLIDYETSYEVASFLSFDMCGMSLGIIDDRSRYWLRSGDKLYSRAVTLSEFAEVAAENAASTEAWISGLLPAALLTQDSEDWRAPTAWEIRHVVGEGSFTGISGAKAALIVGVTPQNFRKYTASDSANMRQSMSFAMWHLLLHKLGVKRA